MFKFQWQIEKAFLELRLGPGLSSASPLNNKRRLENHAADHVLMTATRKGDAHDFFFFFFFLQLLSFIIQNKARINVISKKNYDENEKLAIVSKMLTIENSHCPTILHQINRHL